MTCPCGNGPNVGGFIEDLGARVDQKVKERVYPVLGASLVAGAALGLLVGYVLWKK
jgi:hypothetical protein